MFHQKPTGAPPSFNFHTGTVADSVVIGPSGQGMSFNLAALFEEATHAIQSVDATAPAVIDAVRGFKIIGRESPIRARLEDDSQWIIEDGNARKLSAEEIAQSLRRAQSFE